MTETGAGDAGRATARPERSSMLVVAPNWPAPSELWQHRLLELLEPRVAAFATWNPLESTWRGRVPVVSLSPRIARLAKLVGLGALARRFGRRQLTARLQQPDVDVALCHYVNLGVALQDVWDRSDKPVLVHAHGYDVTWDFRLPGPPYARRFPDRYVDQVRRLARRAWLLANSQFTADRLLAAGIPADRVFVKPLGVPVDPAPREPRPVRDEVRLLYLGRLVDFKGPEATLRAFEIACDRGLRGRLTLAGDGLLRAACERLRNRSRHADRIELLGAVDAAQGARLRHAADLFTAHNCKGPFSNQEEAYGVSIVEAMADELPVVTGRNGGAAETVVDGVTGTLFEPGDVEAHAAALLRLAEDPSLRRRMGEAGRLRALEKYSTSAERQIWNSIFARIGLADWRLEEPR